MPRSAGISVENSFVKGLVTEATGLSFPENACTETFDCIFNKTGEVTRRKGFEYESSYVLYDLVNFSQERGENATSTYRWSGAGGDGDATFIVTQVGQYIHFYAVSNTLSNNKNTRIVDLSDFAVSGATAPYEERVDFASGDGKLFVVGKEIEPFYVTYTPSTDTISAGTQITIKIRDFEGIDDTLDVDERPTASVTTDTAAVNAHLYNLMNQGWANSVFIDASPTQENPVKDWDAAETTLPSNSDRWWQLKNSSDQMAMGELDKFPVTTTEAPKGHFIFNAFDVNRGDTSIVVGTDSTGGKEDFDTLWGRSGLTNKASVLTSTYSDSTSYRPTAVAFFGNRIFYAGVDDDGYNGKVYFSQILSDISHAGHCYQEQDPTSETLFDLLATDGGVIEIPDIASVTYMFASKNNLYVFATNGIWQITGSEGIGFTATDYSVSKLSSSNNLRNGSYVDLNGTPAWINADGIWILKEDDTLGSNSVTSVSKDSIQSFFEDNIPQESLPYIQGTYNPKERLVYWLFRSTSAASTSEAWEYDRCLVMNTETGAFYPWKLNTNTKLKVIGIATATGFGRENTSVNVTSNSGADTVFEVDLTTNVTAGVLSSLAVGGTMKLLVEDSAENITWAEQWDTDYLDWTVANTTGLNYTSYFITGYKIRGEAIRVQQTGYITVHSRVEANSSVKIQGVWDYYTSDGARWSTEQQGYKAGTNTTYTERRLKIRGNGLALQLRFASEQGKPFNIIGWASSDSIVNVP